MRSLKLARVVGAALLLGSVLGCGKEPSPPRAGDEAPAYSFTAADGSVVSNETLKGQVVLLNFWSTTCAPCVREIPDLQKLDDSKQVAVIGIALDSGGWKAVRPCVQKHRVQYRVVLGDEDAFQRFDGYGLPHSLLLDRNQRVVKIYRGAVSREVIERDVKVIHRKS
jgi:thiol-disulfide isomerase/thioredoxin